MLQIEVVLPAQHILKSAKLANAITEVGNASQISPHDPETGEWIYYSKNVKTGRIVRVNMEKLVQSVERVTGEKFLIETFEPVD